MTYSDFVYALDPEFPLLLWSVNQSGKHGWTDSEKDETVDEWPDIYSYIVSGITILSKKGGGLAFGVTLEMPVNVFDEAEFVEAECESEDQDGEAD